jgi:hypothetical protein
MNTAGWVVRLIHEVRDRALGLVVTVSSAVLAIAAFSPAASVARGAKETPVRVAAAPVIPTPPPPVTPAPVAAPSLDIDVASLMRHVDDTTRLVGHPARELVAMLGTAATATPDVIEWNLDDVGGSTYGYASIVDGAITGVVIRGRATLERLEQLHVRRPLRLTMAGGERPSFSIDAGE